MSTVVKNKSLDHENDNEFSGYKWGVRHIQIVLCFLLLLVGYSMRVNISVAIVSMTSKSSDNPDIPVYDWDDQSLVLSSFYWGYFTLQIFAAYVGKKYGPKWFLVTVMTLNSILCALTPIMADNFGSKAVMAVRFLQGLSQGFLFPSVHTLLSNWAPKPERSRFSGFVYSGCLVGTALGSPITGFISKSWAGWPMCFYVFTALGVSWTLLWILFGSNKPSEHKFISKRERCYIESSLGHEDEVKHKIPWKSILTSVPFLSIVSVSVSACYGNTFLLTETPTYLDKILGFNIAENSLLSAAPSVASLLFGLIMGPISDYIINNKILSMILTRKIFNTTGTIIPAIAMAIICLLPTDYVTLSVALLIFNGAVSSGYMLGAQVNLLDLSPNHGGILMGIANGFGNFFSMLAPLITQFVVIDQTDQAEWREVFLSSSVLYIVAGILYNFFASADIQPWNEEDDLKQKTESA